MKLQITRAKAPDIPGILKIQRAAFKEQSALNDDCDMPTMHEAAKDALEEMNRLTILKAEIDGVLAGSIRYRIENNICYLGKLSVSANFRNQGVGSALIRECERLCQNCNAFELFTGSKSHSNILLYEKLGYVQKGKKVVSPLLTFVFLRKENKSV